MLANLLNLGFVVAATWHAIGVPSVHHDSHKSLHNSTVFLQIEPMGSITSIAFSWLSVQVLVDFGS